MTPLQQVGYLALFRKNPNFLRLYLARLVSLFGDWFNLIAILALLRDIRQISSGDFGWILILKTLPNVLVSPTAGVIADRFSRRKIMMVSDMTRAMIVLAMFIMLWYPNIILLYALVIAQTIGSAFFEPARNALLPDLISKDDLGTANAISAATWSAMLTLGSAIGGVYTAWFGWQSALVVDIASYLLSMYFLCKIQEPLNKKVSSKDRFTLLGLQEIQEGIAYVLERPRILSLMLVKSGWCFAGAIPLLLALLGEQIFSSHNQGILGVTLLYVARGFGTGLGPILSRSMIKQDPAKMERFILYGYLCGALFYTFLPLTNHLLLAVLFIMCAHLGGSTLWVFSTVRLQQIVSTEIRGRVFAAQQACFTIMISLTTWLYSWLSDVQKISLKTLLFVMGLSLFFPAILWSIRGHVYGWAKQPNSHLSAK